VRKTVAYYRSSTDLQENSIPMQQDQVRKFCLKEVMSVQDEYEDKGVSARKNTVFNRPEMNRLIRDIRANQIGTVLVYKRDRLARNAVEYMEFYRLCRKHNVEIRFTADNEFPVFYTPLGEFIELIMAGMVEHEANQIAERIRATQIANFRQKRRVGNLPYGYKEKPLPKNLMGIDFEHKGMKKELQTIFREFISMKPSNLSVFTTYINDLGFMRIPSTKKKKKVQMDEFGRKIEDVPRPFEDSDFTAMFTNELYKGVHKKNFGGTEIVVLRPECRVVSDEDWQTAYELIQPFLSKPREPRPFDFLLEHFAVCSECKKPLNIEIRWHGGEDIPMYECRDKDHKTKIRASKCHYEVFKVILRRLKFLLDERSQELYRMYKSREERSLKQEIRRQQEVVTNLEEKFVELVTRELEDGKTFRATETLDEVENLRDQLDNARQVLNELNRKLEDWSLLPHLVQRRTELVQKLKDRLKEMNPTQVRNLLGDILVQVTVKRNQIDRIILKEPFKHAVKGDSHAR
jgi:site-specific DNA recombinase